MVTLRSSSMSSNTTIFSRPTTVIRRIVCGWLLDEHVLARRESPLREVVMRRDRRRDHDRVDVRGEHLVERGGDPSRRMARPRLRKPLLVEVAEPGERAELGEVPGQVRSPV